MNARTDFADELISKQKLKKEYKMIVKKKNNIKVSTIDILKDNNSFNKEKGRYISIDFESMHDDKTRKNISKSLQESLHLLFEMKNNDKVLIVGLGNDKIIADSLGPLVADQIMVTNHLFTIYPNGVDKNVNRVCVFTPKVMGQTGLESSDLIVSVAKLFKPDLVIIIDALASSSITRINKVIQLSNTGIAPGSGVGNHRKEINEKILNTKIISIGVATVVEANKIVKELDNNIIIPDDSSYNLILTPKEIDEDVKHLSTIIASSINNFIHNDYSTL